MDAMVIQGTPDVAFNDPSPNRWVEFKENSRSAPTAGSSEVGAWRWSCEVIFLYLFLGEASIYNHRF